jgi:hypothetical protein
MCSAGFTQSQYKLDRREVTDRRIAGPQPKHTRYGAGPVRPGAVPDVRQVQRYIPRAGAVEARVLADQRGEGRCPDHRPRRLEVGRRRAELVMRNQQTTEHVSG